jgi:micrococcal nuclease
MTAEVVRIIDGDTLVLRTHGRGTRVRLIGVDAPETWTRRDCFGAEAARALRRLVPPGSAVRAAGDVEPRDRYGRRLLYLWTRRGVLVNTALVRAGFARAMAVAPDTRYAAVLREAEDAARRARSGLWRPAPAGCGPSAGA